MRRHISASMAVALTALVMALSGTAVAASSLVNGDRLIRKGTLSGNRLRDHTVIGKQINMRRLGTVPKATNAAYATNAAHATNAAFNSLFASIPVQFRPSQTVYLSTNVRNGDPARIDVFANGNAQIEPPSSTSTSEAAYITSLDGITYALG